MSVTGRELNAREPHAFAGHRPVGRVEVFVFTKGRFHQRGEVLDEHNAAMLLLLQGAEIKPCIELEKCGNDRQGEERGKPCDAHRRLTLCSPCSRGCGSEREGVLDADFALTLFARQDIL
jgi:hypothetical protein